jgi:mannose-6-phosphate isomerase-like protein (cupin superfamily)
MVFETKKLNLDKPPDAIAPDGSEIRYLLRVKGGSVVHCLLPVGAVTQAVKHQTVEEVWYVLAGNGEVWRKQGELEETTPLEQGISVSIPLGITFQFRNVGDVPLQMILATTPPWPDDDSNEVVFQENHWEK